MNSVLETKLQDLPKEPGVYFHKNAAGEIIYIGKAAVLRNRVRQYFQKSRNRDPKTEALVAEIADIDWMVVETELDALFLEAELVRRYLPPYNILLRDDKSLSYIRINYSDPHPTVTFTRRPLDDGAKYFGPYMSAFSLRRALKVLRRIFPYSTHVGVVPKRACLQYHLGLCPGLEEDKTSLKDYRDNLKKLMQYFKGERVRLINELERDMKQAAAKKDFEQAAEARNQVYALKSLTKQIIFSDKEFLDISKDQGLQGLSELLGLYKSNRKAQPTHVDGVLGDSENRTDVYPEYEEGESQLATQQSATTSVGVTGSSSQQGRGLRLLRRIEGYDISHMQGTDNVASMVVFVSGVPDKAAYRKFKLRIPGNDDFAHMHEAVSRRLSAKNRSDWGVPDIMLIDGGKGQLSAAIRARDEAGLSIPMIGLAKREEEIVIHKSRSMAELQPEVVQSLGGIITESEDFLLVLLLKDSHIVKLLQRIRDESHRFAVSYHSVLKTKRQTLSMLDEIPTIGPLTRKKLLRTFGSLRGIMQARDFELEKVVGVKRAAILAQYIRAAKKSSRYQ